MKKRLYHIIFLIFTTILFTFFTSHICQAIAPPPVGTYLVDHTRPDDNGDGTSWATAKKTIQAALEVALSGNEVWVKAGTYNESISLKDGVALYGGFIGTESALGERDWATNVTTIDGQGAVDHVVTGTDNATIDGFTITGGNADGGGVNSSGGGMLNNGVSPTVSNCTFSSNSAVFGGGGMYNENSSPTVTNCTFQLNSAGLTGGGMDNWQSTPSVKNCTFHDNQASFNGGGICNSNSAAIVENCIFSANTATDNGGGIETSGPASLSVTNCTFYGNSAATGGGIYIFDGSHTLTNCIFWGDSAGTGKEIHNKGGAPTVTYCDVEEGHAGAGNINSDPLFVNPASWDFHLQPGSPCIDAANSTGAPANDKDGNPRYDDPNTDPNTGAGTNGNHYDIGAYEYQALGGLYDVSFKVIKDGNPLQSAKVFIYSDVNLSPDPDVDGITDVNGIVDDSGTTNFTLDGGYYTVFIVSSAYKTAIVTTTSVSLDGQIDIDITAEWASTATLTVNAKKIDSTNPLDGSLYISISKAWPRWVGCLSGGTIQVHVTPYTYSYVGVWHLSERYYLYESDIVVPPGGYTLNFAPTTANSSTITVNLDNFNDALFIPWLKDPDLWTAPNLQIPDPQNNIVMTPGTYSIDIDLIKDSWEFEFGIVDNYVFGSGSTKTFDVGGTFSIATFDTDLEIYEPGDTVNFAIDIQDQYGNSLYWSWKPGGSLVTNYPNLVIKDPMSTEKYNGPADSFTYSSYVSEGSPISGIYTATLTFETGPQDSISKIIDFQVGTQDSDGDGMDDDWEITHFGNITYSDGTGDDDNDGLTDLEEFENNADPTNFDSDGDVVSDGDEVNNGTDPTNASDYTPPGTGTISGTVKDFIGTAITGIQIQVDVISGDPCGWRWTQLSAYTNPADGTYAIANVTPASNYYLQTNNMSQSNYVNEWWTNGDPDPSSIDCGSALSFTVNAGDYLTGKDFQLDFGGSISGTVYQSDGITPIPNLHVYTTDYETDEWMGSTDTDEHGSYTITGLPSGTYRVKACAFCCSGLPYVDEYYYDVYNSDAATPVPVIAPKDTPNINFTLASILARGTIDDAITDGLAWLEGEQNPDGSWGTQYALAKTALAVLSLEIYAADHGFSSPFDPMYQYHVQVENGLNYIFANAYSTGISMQPAGNPDGDGDGIGVYFDLPGNSLSIYNTSMAMMAIAASNAPDTLVDVPGSPVDGWTYRQALQDVVDYIAWAQTDSGYGTGGWNYGPTDNGGDRSDQSNSGWVTMGLAYAEAEPPEGFGLSISGFVRTELDVWIDYIQDDVDGDDNDGGADYTGPDDPDENPWVNILKTGNLLQQMAFVGDTETTLRVQDAIDYLVRHWQDANSDPGWRGCPTCYHATYTTMKGLAALGIDSIDSIDWFQEFTDALLSEQTSDGWWPACCFDDGEKILSTEWVLLTLQRAIAPPIEKPDLVIIDEYVEWVDEANGTYSVSYTVKNTGNSEAPAGHDVGLTLDGAFKEEKAVPVALAPGATHSDTFVAVATLSDQTDEITVCADRNGEVDELSEENNCATILWSPSIVAGTFYVDISSGNDDTGVGSSDNPWKTLHYTIYCINEGSPGSYTLHVAPGTYWIDDETEPDETLNITQNNVTVIGESGSMPVLNGGGSGATNWLVGIETEGDNITIKNLEIKLFEMEGILISGDNTNIFYCHVHDNGTGGVNATGIQVNDAGLNSHVKIIDCDVHDNGRAGNGDGIGVIDADNVTIKGCDIDNNVNAGIYVRDATTNVYIEENLIEENPTGISIIDCSPTVMRNEIENNDTGIYIEGSAAAASPIIWNNIIYPLYSTIENGIGVNGNASPTIYHNTIDGGSNDGIYTNVSSGTTVIKYNIITNFGGNGITVEVDSQSPTIDYNDVWNNTGSNYSNCSAGPNDINPPEDPLYKDIITDDDYTLQSASPCIDKIPAGDPVDIDYFGYSRPRDDGFDMGAYEFVADSTYNTSLPGGSGAVTDYRIFTLPVYIGTGADLKTAMEAQLGVYNKYQWRLSAWDGINNKYIEMDEAAFAALPVEPGFAAWLISLGTDPVSFSGPLAPDGTYYTIPLLPGWNMFGLPWTSIDINVENIAVSDGVNNYWITSENNTLTQKYVWDYTGSGSYSGYEQIALGSSIQPGKGYWINVLAGSSVKLLVPPDNSGGYFSAKSYRAEGTSSDSEDEEPPPPPGGVGSDSSGVKVGAGGGCFIATAAYGSVLHPYVKILRDFRDTYLLSNDPGKTFVALYYHYSPPLAELISDNTPLKYLTRLFLLPLIGFSAFMLYAGAIFKCAFLVALSLILLSVKYVYVTRVREG